MLAKELGSPPLPVAPQELALANLGVSASDLLSYANKLDEIPFAQNICQFPLPKTLPQLPSFEDCNEAAPSHIPAFLPAFPEPHARMDTAQFPEAQNDPETRQEKLTEQQKQAQQALLKVQAREAPESDLLKHAARMPEPEKDIALAQQAGQPTLPNPFLAPTVWNGEEGPHPTIPASGAEGQPPIDQGAQWGHLADMEIDEGAASGFRTFKVADGLSTRDVLATSGR